MRVLKALLALAVIGVNLFKLIEFARTGCLDWDPTERACGASGALVAAIIAVATAMLIGFIFRKPLLRPAERENPRCADSG